MGFSVIREMGLRAAAYDNVIDLGIGEPDFDTPSEISRQALLDAFDGHTHYTPSKGDTELISEISVLHSRQAGLLVSPSQIVITHGGMGALACAMQTLVEAGQDVLVPEPFFPAYRAHVGYPGGRLTPIATRFEEGFALQPDALERAITPTSKVLLLNSPNNPTGCVLSGSVLDELAEIVRSHDLLVVSDEVYDRLVYSGQFESIYTRPGMAERTVVVKSFSKTYAMTGWRVGYAWGPTWIMEEMLKVVNYNTACPSSVGQRAALAALRMEPGPFNAMRTAFRRRIDLVCRRLEQMPGLKVFRPQGSFYIFVDVRAIAEDSRAFALDLLDQQQVAVVPGYAFGASGQGYVRIACTLKRKLLNKAMDRLESFIC